MKALKTRLAAVAKRESVTRAEAFAGFANVSAAGMRRNPREYPGIVKRWRPESVVDFAAALGELGQAMRERPFDDLLGPFYMSFAEGADRGEFYTPAAAARFIGRWALGGYRQGDGTYRGRVYSPDRDQEYASRLVLSGDALAVSGCMLGICREGGTWARVR